MAEDKDKLRILVCDDEPVVRDLLSIYFKKLNCHVDCTKDGDEMLDKFNAGEYDVVFLDILLPGKDGIALLKEIRKDKPQTVVLMTGYAVEEGEAKALGAMDYLYKPFDMDKIQWIIDRVKREKGKI